MGGWGGGDLESHIIVNLAFFFLLSCLSFSSGLLLLIAVPDDLARSLPRAAPDHFAGLPGGSGQSAPQT